MKTFQKTLLVIAIFLIVIGGIFAIVGSISSAGKWKNFIRERWEENMDLGGFSAQVENVESLSIEIKQGRVQILKGDTFKINCSEAYEDKIVSEVENGTWKVKEKGRFGSFLNNIFHFNYNPLIQITLPEGFIGKEMEIYLDAGSLEIEQLLGEEVEIGVGAGKCETNMLKASSSLKMEVGAGELDINGLDASNVSMECGAGSMKAVGVITGESKVDCGIGEVRLTLAGRMNDYNYSVDCGLGQVRVNESTYNATASKSVTHEGALHSFTIDCGLGKVTLDMAPN